MAYCRTRADATRLRHDLRSRFDSRTQVRPDQWGCVSTCGGVRKARSASLPHSGQITWPPAGLGPSNSHLHEGHRHSLIIIFLVFLLVSVTTQALAG